MSEPEAWLAGPEAWLAGPEAWLTGPQAWLAGPQAWLDGPEGGTYGRTYGQTDVRTDVRTENLPILQDFVPYWGRCPKSEKICWFVGLSVKWQMAALYCAIPYHYRVFFGGERNC